MKRPGLTEAMRRALESPGAGDRSMREKLHALGLLSEAHWYTAKLTPRGQAALAAPRVTAAELALLIYLEGVWSVSGDHHPVVWANVDKKGWLETNPPPNDDEIVLSDAGTTALNNVRAASGSVDWREHP